VHALRTRSWPWFVIALALGVLGLAVLSGVVAGVTAFLAMIAFLGACIRGLAADVGDDPKRLTGVVRTDGFMGLMATERARERREHDPPL
jgi:hypothetical protein